MSQEKVKKQEKKVKKQGFSIFPPFDNVDDLNDWVHTFTGAQLTIAIIVMMRTMNTMRKVYDETMDEAIRGRNETTD